MTFAELKAQLDRLTPVQLAAEVAWVGDERGGKVHSLWIADEDWIVVDGDCEPRSTFEADDQEGAEVAIPAGTPQLLVDI